MGLGQGWLLKMVEKYSMLEEEKEEKEFLFLMKQDIRDSLTIFTYSKSSLLGIFFCQYFFIESRFALKQSMLLEQLLFHRYCMQ